MFFFFRIFKFFCNLTVASINIGLLASLKYFFYKKKDINYISSSKFKNKIYFRKFGDYGAISHLYTLSYIINDSRSNNKIKNIIDAGANIGIETIKFKKTFPNTNIICIEPNKSNFEILKKNVESYDYVACINAALYNKETEVILEHPPFSNTKQKSQNFNESFRISNKKNLINTEKVKTVTMSKIIDEYQLKRINILKLDIEGAEKYIFDNTADNWINKVDVLIFECPDDDFGAEGVTQQIFNIISKNNLKFKSHICGENLILIKFDTNYFLEQKVYLI